MHTETFSQNPELIELLDCPEVAEVMAALRKNNLIAELLGDQHTNQYMETAEEQALAFKHALPKASGSIVEQNIREAKDRLRFLDVESGEVSDDDLRKVFEKVWVYSRLTNPTNELLEEVVSLLEGTEKTALFASGLAAVDAAVRQFSEPAVRGGNGEYLPGGKILVIGAIYGGTFAQLQDTLKETGRRFQHLPITDFLNNGLPDDTSVVYFETSNNPTLRVSPIEDIVEEAKRVGAVSVCDNTFTPLIVKPASFGVDLTVNSMTKYYNGYSEDLGGSVSGSAEKIGEFLDLHKGRRMLGGAVMAPRVAKDFLKKLSSMPERLLEGTRNARALHAAALERGFEARTIESYGESFNSLRNKRLPGTLMNGMLTLDLGTSEKARLFVNEMVKIGVGRSAVSLGSVTTYYSIPAETTHSELDEEELRKARIAPGLVRISCGVEGNLVQKAIEVLERLSDV